MVDPLSIAALVYIGVIAVVFVAVTIDELYSWFRNKDAIKERSKEVIAFTLAQQINSKKYVEVPGVFGGTPTRTQVIQGFYDKKANRIIEGRMMKSNKRTDDAVAHMHDEGAGMVVYR